MAVIAFPPDSIDVNAKRVVFNQNSIPGISGTVYYQYDRAGYGRVNRRSYSSKVRYY